MCVIAKLFNYVAMQCGNADLNFFFFFFMGNVSQPKYTGNVLYGQNIKSPNYSDKLK